MIKVTIYYQSGKPVGIHVNGHAGQSKYGHDLVCAAVSSVVTGGFNSFQDSEIDEVILEEGHAELMIKQNSIAIAKLEVIITQLKTIKRADPDYLEINERRCTK